MQYQLFLTKDGNDVLINSPENVWQDFPRLNWLNLTDTLSLNWIDNETLELIPSDDFNDTNFTFLRLIYDNQSIRYYKCISNTPIDTPNGIKMIQRFKLDWKLSFFEPIAKTLLNYDLEIIRTNTQPWNNAINFVDPTLDKIYEKYQPIIDYKTIRLEENVTFTHFSPGAVPRPEPLKVNGSLCIYYVFNFEGKVWLFPLLIHDPDRRTNLNHQYNVYFKNFAPLPSFDNFDNFATELDLFASQKEKSGFIGKFIGPNLNLINGVYYIGDPQKPKFWNIHINELNRNCKFVGIPAHAGMFNGALLEIPLGYDFFNNYHVNSSFEMNSNSVTYAHLMYSKIRLYGNDMNIAPLIFDKYKNADENISIYKATFGYTDFNAQFLPNGIFTTLISNDKFIGDYYKFTKLDNLVIQYSNQLPTHINAYETWLNNNNTALQTSIMSKTIGSIVTILTGLGTALLAPFTGGSSLLAGAAVLGGVSGTIGGLTKITTDQLNNKATYEQAKKSQVGNIRSSDGLDFSYLALTHGRGSKVMSNDQLYIYELLPNECVKEMNRILYYYGYYGSRILKPLWNVKQDFDFNFYQFNNTEHLKNVIYERINNMFFAKKAYIDKSPDEIANYVIQVLTTLGLRIWRHKEY